MKKAEIEAATNAELITVLMRMLGSSRILKSSQTLAKQICKELEQRKVITDADSLFKEWDALYSV